VVDAEGLQQAPKTVAQVEAQGDEGQEIETADGGLGEGGLDQIGHLGLGGGKVEVKEVDGDKEEDGQAGVRHGGGIDSGRQRSADRVAAGPGGAVIDEQEQPGKHMDHQDEGQQTLRHLQKRPQGMQVGGIGVIGPAPEEGGRIAQHVDKEKDTQEEAGGGGDGLLAHRGPDEGEGVVHGWLIYDCRVC
jgi:hypothetical protein